MYRYRIVLPDNTMITVVSDDSIRRGKIILFEGKHYTVKAAEYFLMDLNTFTLIEAPVLAVSRELANTLNS